MQGSHTPTHQAATPHMAHRPSYPPRPRFLGLSFLKVLRPPNRNRSKSTTRPPCAPLSVLKGGLSASLAACSAAFLAASGRLMSGLGLGLAGVEGADLPPSLSFASLSFASLSLSSLFLSSLSVLFFFFLAPPSAFFSASPASLPASSSPAPASPSAGRFLDCGGWGVVGSGRKEQQTRRSSGHSAEPKQNPAGPVHALPLRPAPLHPAPTGPATFLCCAALCQPRLLHCPLLIGDNPWPRTPANKLWTGAHPLCFHFTHLGGGALLGRAARSTSTSSSTSGAAGIARGLLCRLINAQQSEHIRLGAAGSRGLRS